MQARAGAVGLRCEAGAAHVSQETKSTSPAQKRVDRLGNAIRNDSVRSSPHADVLTAVRQCGPARMETQEPTHRALQELFVHSCPLAAMAQRVLLATMSQPHLHCSHTMDSQ